MTWRLKEADPAAVDRLVAEGNFHPIVATLLANRKLLTVPDAEAYLNDNIRGLHDPADLPGAARAAEIVVDAVQSNRRICIYGDYDVDGTTATAILWGLLKQAGANVTYYIPHRVDEGYGLNDDAIRQIKAEGADLVVSVDCGITAVDQAKLAREIGLDLIITDHHHFNETLPDALALVHPRLPGSQYPFGELCGAAVSFKLAWQIAKLLGDGEKAGATLRDYLVRSLGLVAMATVADMVPLLGENRILVRHGLAQVTREPSPGLKALLKIAGHRPAAPVTATTVGFGLAPRINAAGRMAFATKAVELFLSQDEEEAVEIAKHLDACNKQRKKLEQTITAQAKQMVNMQGGLGDRGALVVAHPDWHTGVVGIVAARLVETYHRPAVVCVLDEHLGHGSARTVGSFNLVEALGACSQDLVGYGGHAAAAGVRVTREKFAKFAADFDEYCRAHLSEKHLEKVVWIDADVDLRDLTPRVVEDIGLLEPYGQGNPRPVLAARDVRLAEAPKFVGEAKNHVQLRLEHRGRMYKGVQFNVAQERFKGLAADDRLDVAFTPSMNEWMGRREVQLELCGVRKAEEE